MIQVRPGTDEDREEIVALIAEVFGAEQGRRAARRWHWQWHGDPRLARPGYRGVVAVWRGRIIASLSCMPAGLHLAGRPVDAHWCVDVLTHWGLARQALRDLKRQGADAGADLSRGIAAALLDSPSAGPIQLAKYIADPMKAILLRIGFRELPHSGNFSRRVSLRQSLAGSLGGALGGMVAVAADLPYAVIPRPSLAVEPLEGPFDDRFDRLWRRVMPGYAAVGLRDAETLNWRYRAHPDTGYRTLLVADAGEIRGYLVLCTYRHGARLRARIVDILAEPEDHRVTLDLMAAGVRLARGAGADRVGCFVTGAPLEAAVQRLGFRPRLKKSKEPQPLMFRGLSAPDLHATAGDGDGG